MSDRDEEYDRSAPDLPTGASGAASVVSLASKALHLVAERRVGGSPQLFERFLGQLIDAILDPNPQARDEVVAAMRRSRFSNDEIAEIFIPEAARRLGEEWCSNGFSFATVTIGSARLQSMLRDLGPDGALTRGYAQDDVGPAILVVATEDHTLGAMVLARILRRHGASVRLVVGRSDTEVVRTAVDGDFDGVMISAASSDRLPRVKGLVEKLKRANIKQIPVIVGGEAVKHLKNPKKATGADYVESDPKKALGLCEAMISQRGAVQRANLE
ncbi:MAG: cobalamin B12-binding domain-containing protein [Rhodobacteraceae bacterium]|nr:cobalamin B12-binding domain-containing protein [Paracoccaceae bacterium]